MFLFKALCDSPPVLSRSSRFTIWNGIIYMAAGALLMSWPTAVQVLFRDAEFVGRESGLVRILGLTVAIIGWFYFVGGRTGARQIVAASVVNRIALVPLVLVPLAVGGVFPHLTIMFAILDPVLALIALYLLHNARLNKSGTSRIDGAGKRFFDLCRPFACNN
jgi:hypothetical protein